MARVDYSKKSVLLVDGSGNMRSTANYMLRSIGVTDVRSSGISRQVLTDIQEQDYDIIMLGHNESDTVSGIQLLEEARYRGYMKPGSCWVFMTSDSSQEAILHALDSCPDVLLTKPFSTEQLRQRLNVVMRQRAVFKSVDDALALGDTETALRICLGQFPPSDKNHDIAIQIACSLLVELKRFGHALQLAEPFYWRTKNKEAGLSWIQALVATDQLDDAKSVARELIETSPMYLPAYEQLALAHERGGEYAEARDVIQMAVAQSPLGIPRQMELGRLATQTDYLDVAEGAYKKSIQLGNKSCYRSSEPFLKLANVKRLALIGGDEKEQEMYEQEIESLLETATMRFRDDIHLPIRTALLKAELNDTLEREDDSQAFLREAKRLNSALKEPLDLKQEVQQFKAEPSAEELSATAEKAGTKGRKRDEAMGSKVNRQGVKHYTNGRVSQAMRHFGLALEYDYANATAMLNLAQVYLELARDDRVKRPERLKMFDRNMRLLAMLPLSMDEIEKHEHLKAWRQGDMERMPDGPLSVMLR